MNLNRIKIGPRLGLGYGVVVTLMIAIVAVAILRLEHLSTDSARLLELQRRATLADTWRSQVHLNASRALAIAKSDGNAAVSEFFAPRIKETSARISKVQEELTGLVDSDKGKALIAEIGKHRQAYVDVRKQVLEKAQAGDTAGAQALLTSAMVPASETYTASIEALTVYQQGRVAEVNALIAKDVERAEMLLMLLGGAAAVLAALFGWLITRSVVSPLAAAIGVTERIAGGDLTQPVSADGRDETADMLRSLSRMQDALGALVGNVRSSSDSIGTASAQIAVGNQDLSSRTEQTASNLQQAASSLEELTGTVSQTADSARTANQLAASASEAAQRGGSVVADVVSTMDEINSRSKKIADIIGTIDGIAFQTNILALNAAVEAARAGEQGRGFAVVAGEVRSLAQRSAEAAKEIKSLIQASVEKVESGSQLVQQAGTVMGDIVGSVRRVTDVIGEISAATAEQTSGLRQVNEAVAQLDQMTQQNAALVEESAAAAESLADQSRKLSGVVAAFRVAGMASASFSVSRAAAPSSSPSPAPAPSKLAAGKLIAQVRKTATATTTASAAASPSKPAAPRPAPAPAPAAAGSEGDWETF